MTKIEFEEDGRISTRWSYGDFYCDVPNSDIKILFPYSGEPSHRERIKGIRTII